MRGGLALLAALVLVASACGERLRHPISEPGPVEAAVVLSQMEGSARTVSQMPPGLLPTLRVTGVVDFRHDRSQTLLEIVRPDGRAAPYAQLARDGEVSWVGWHLGAAEPRWQRLDGKQGAPAGDVSLHVDGLAVLRAVREQRDELAPAGDTEREWRRAGAATPGPDNVVGILVETLVLDADGRVERVAFTLPAMRQHGAFWMTFSDYGDAPAVEVPEV